jgi:hypothetical protein
LLASTKLLANFENPLSNPLHRPYSGDFNPENAYRKPPVNLKTVPAMIVSLKKSTDNREAKTEIHQRQRRKAVRNQLTDAGRGGGVYWG